MRKAASIEERSRQLTQPLNVQTISAHAREPFSPRAAEAAGRADARRCSTDAQSRLIERRLDALPQPNAPQG
jgi:hypothetical protein